MSETIRVPDSVYERVTEEADQKDISRGAVVRGWMEDADELASRKIVDARTHQPNEDTEEDSS